MSTFEEMYLAVRKKEGRLYDAEQVRRLPHVPKSDALYRQWIARKAGADRFVAYLREKGKTGQLLEVGCGNGWFSNYLVQRLNGLKVTAQDINAHELGLGKQAFPHARITWTTEDLFSLQAPYNLVVFNSSVQYFPDLKKLIQKAGSLLLPGGEIHILDSPFYRSEEERKAARGRTVEYYERLGYPGLAGFYTPHLYAELEGLKYEILYAPPASRNLLQKIMGIRPNPFPWICIRKS
jgi:SAM-dependent methyltransferase